jgi:hypothetical protein
MRAAAKGQGMMPNLATRRKNSNSAGASPRNARLSMLANQQAGNPPRDRRHISV